MDGTTTIEARRESHVLERPGIFERPGPTVALLTGVWLALRVAFFEGLWGYDDLDHIDYAMNPGAPQNVFHGRLLLNGLLIAAYRAFGAAEWVWALPTLLGSFVFVMTVHFTARRLFTPGQALLAGLLAACLVLDVTISTDPNGSPLGNAFAAVGTALLVTGEDRRRLAGAGMAFAGAMLSHLGCALYVGPAIVAYALHDRPRRWRGAALVFGVTAVTWLVVDSTLFLVLTGDPLGHYALLVGTHLREQPYGTLPPRLPSGAPNPDFFWWSVRHFVFSKHFGFLISLPLLLAVAHWKRWDRAGRLLVLSLAGGWFYINFGSQHPLEWQPLGKLVRYWYPLSLPAVLVAVMVLRAIRRPLARRAYVAALWLPIPVMLLSAGSWGQNVEITRELAAFAEAHPEATFVTDPYTWDEMFLLGGRRAPPNVTVFDHPEADLRAEVRPPRARRLPMAPGDYYALVNVMHLHRPNARAFAEFVAAHMERRPISPPTWRLIAAALPEAARDAHPWLRRKPPAELAAFPGRPWR